ncbi:MAG: glycosyltransferase [Saprospiraceae bacterium]|nr:MAG: glycosyltransferase [Saprospiraceae bacterium]
MELWSLLYLFAGGVFVFFLVLPFVEVLFSFFKKEKLRPFVEPVNFDFGCIITAYKNAEIAKGLVRSLLAQHYANFMIYLVADACDLSGWDIAHEKLVVLRPPVPLNLKAKSIIHTIENFHKNHGYIAVFDADNLAHPDFLGEINRYANAGFTCIQGQRTAKNLDTVYACADATGEFYKNYVERLLPYRLGSSAVISGSGMAVEASLYKAYLASPEIEQGKHLWKRMLQEDKILQNFILRENGRIAYAGDALVYDEKVTTARAVETQRSRWLFSYFQNLPNSIGLLRRGLLGLSFNQLLFGLITLSPPLFILLFGALALSAAGLFFVPWMAATLVAAVAVFCANILLVLYLSHVPAQVWTALWGLPLFIWNQVKALLKIGNPDRNFKHTEHTRNVNLEEVMKS